MDTMSGSPFMSSIGDDGLSYSSALAQSGFSGDILQPRTLYVGNLDPSTTEELIHTLFAPYGRITGLKLIHDNLNDPYCFVEYEDHTQAANALMTMNKRVLLDREIKVNWASNSGVTASKQVTAKHFHIFVGDLSPEIETQQLRDAFSIFGEISDCRVVRDLQTFKSKCYGFVSYVRKQDAESAIANMNGQWLGNRAIRTNWASRKPPTQKNDSIIGTNTSSRHAMNFDEVYNQSSPTNCTVYCGGITNGLTEELIENHFSRFGSIQEIRVFKDKGYAFIKFSKKEAATNAILSMHNRELNGQAIKCSWGKDSIESGVSVKAQLAQSLTSPLILQYHPGQQLPYSWYSQFGAGLQNAAGQSFAMQAAPTALPYPYGQMFPATAVSSSGGPNPGVSFNPSSMQMWPATGTASLPGALSLTPQNNLTSILQQSTAPIGPFPLQGFQAQ